MGGDLLKGSGGWSGLGLDCRWVHLGIRRGLVVAAGVLAAAVYVLLLYRVSLHWVPNSDNSSVALFGEAVVNRNPWLRGWTLGADPFWASEVPMYALGVALVGLGPSLTHLLPTAVWAALTGISMYLAAAGAPRRAWAVSAVSAGSLIGVVGPGYFQGAIHIVTSMLGIGAIAATYAAATGRLKVAWALAAIVSLASSIAGDPLAVGAFAAPLAVGAITVAIATRAPRWLYLLVIPVSAYALASLLLNLKDLRHGYSAIAFHPVPTVNLDLIVHTLTSLVGMLSLWPLNLAGVGGVMLSGGRWLIVGVAVAGLLTLRRSLRFSEAGLFLTVTLLVVGAADMLGFALFAGEPGSEGRRLIPALIALAILLARLAGSAYTALPRATLTACSVAAVAEFAVLLGLAASPTPDDPHLALGSWLQARGLVTGYADYWDASIVSVDTRGAVRVYPVTGSQSGLAPFPFNSNADWYSPTARARAQFVVFNKSETTYGVDEQSAAAEFGAPSEVQHVGRFTVLIWNRGGTAVNR